MGSGSERFRLQFGPDSERALAIIWAGRVGKAPEVNQTLCSTVGEYEIPKCLSAWTLI